MSVELLKEALKDKKKLIEDTLNSAPAFIPVFKYKSKSDSAKKDVQPDIVKFTMVDRDRGQEVVDAGRWYVSGEGKYAIKRIGGRKIRLHTFLTGYKQTDHKNGNGFLNTSENLREATQSQNMRNRRYGNGSDYVCVSVNSAHGHKYWQTKIKPDNSNLVKIFQIKKTASKNICHNEKLAAFALDYAVELLGISEWYRLNNTKHLLTDEEIVMVQEKVERQLKKHKLI